MLFQVDALPKVHGWFEYLPWYLQYQNQYDLNTIYVNKTLSLHFQAKNRCSDFISKDKPQLYCYQRQISQCPKVTTNVVHNFNCIRGESTHRSTWVRKLIITPNKPASKDNMFLEDWFSQNYLKRTKNLH
jgi:hypothetical protein